MANIVDYQNLQQAKINTGNKFDEMLQNLESMRSQVQQMNESSWKGSSSNVFNEIFDEIKTKVNSEREEFNKAIDERLTIWHNEFTDAEKAQIQAAQNM
jgi:uncharacterized protein YukE